jgi:putative copper export protein
MLEALTALLKLVLYAGVLSGSGAVLAEATLRPSAEDTRYLTKVARWASAVVLVACPLITLILIMRLGGELDEPTLTAVFHSGSGAALFLQLTGAVLLLTSGSDDGSILLRLSYAILPLLGFAFSGHAAAVGPTEGIVAVLHVSAAAWWVGSLHLLRERCAHAQFAHVVALVARFSSMAFILAGALVILGLALIMILVDFSADPWLTPYGWILGAKVCVVGAVLAVAGYNRRRLTPRLNAGDTSAAAALHSTVNIEMALIATVLAITSILTTYASPHD